MRIATWNINGLRARLDFLKLWLRERQPDMVGLQELKLTDEQFPHAEIEAEGYLAITHGQKSWNGVAVLVRDPDGSGSAVEVAEVGLPGQEDFGARLLSVQREDFIFVTAYCPNGKNLEHDDFTRKLEWFDTLAKHLPDRYDLARPFVICGDFNICPAGIDSWNDEKNAGGIFHTAEERARFQAILELGLVDLFRHLHPEERKFSWWDYRGGAFHRGLGLRIDFLLGNNALVDRVQRVEIDREWRKKKDGLTASDHAPVVAELSD